jgi:hypothetical protein
LTFASPTAQTADHPVDILLVQPPIRDFYLTAKRTLPAGLISIAATLRREGFSVGLFDALARGKSKPLPLPDGWEDLGAVYGPADNSPFGLFQRYRHFGYSLSTIASAARQSGAFLVGISSLFSAYEDMALATADVIKKSCPDATVVMGGHHPSALPGRLLAHPAVDCILRGDGEATLPMLARAVAGHHPLSSVPGIGYRAKGGRLHIAPPAYVDDLDQLPVPAFDLVRTRYYARRRRASLVVSASRGCPLQCSYCCTGKASRIPYRRRSVAHVMAEIAAAAAETPIGLIDFEDENVSLDRRWFLALLQAIRRYFEPHPPELRAMNGLFPASLDEEVVAGMRRAGFQCLNLSLGSTDPVQQRRFGRPDLTDAFDRILQAAHRQGMTAVGYLIAGAPDQAPRGVVDDLLFLAGRRVLAALSVFYPAPGSHDFERCRQGHLLPAEIARWRSSALPTGTAEDRLAGATLLRLARILNFMKHCRDATGRIPDPAPLKIRTMPEAVDRQERGRMLLQGFLYDGIIRGIDPQGRVFAHRSADDLVQAFREGLGGITLKGVVRD